MTKKELKILNECVLFKDSGYTADKKVFVFSAGEEMCSPESEKRMGVILSGRAKAVAADGQTLLNLFEKGDVFKAAGLFATSETCTFVIAETSVKAVFFNESEMSEHIRQNPKISENYIRFLSERIGFLNQKISFFSLPTTEARLARYLYCTDEQEINISSAKLSLILSVARASLYRAFKSLEKQGAILHKTGNIKIIDKNILKENFKGEKL